VSLSRRCIGSYPTALPACQIALREKRYVQFEFKGIAPIEKDFSHSPAV